MNAQLEKTLAALSVSEKAEVVDLLLPDVISEGEPIPPEWLAELDRRDAAHEADPSAALTLREFDRKWFGGE
jgi:putative addiction module component (TIGR02574 family)